MITDHSIQSKPLIPRIPDEWVSLRVPTGLFPPMEADDLATLTEDIRAHGLPSPFALFRPASLMIAIDHACHLANVETPVSLCGANEKQGSNSTLAPRGAQAAEKLSVGNTILPLLHFNSHPRENLNHLSTINHQFLTTPQHLPSLMIIKNSQPHREGR